MYPPSWLHPNIGLSRWDIVPVFIKFTDTNSNVPSENKIAFIQNNKPVSRQAMVGGLDLEVSSMQIWKHENLSAQRLSSVFQHYKDLNVNVSFINNIHLSLANNWKTVKYWWNYSFLRYPQSSLVIVQIVSVSGPDMWDSHIVIHLLQGAFWIDCKFMF